MPGIHREDDTTKGHGGFSSTKPASWSTDVYVNSKGVVRNGDTIVPHGHSGTYVGTSTVYVNSKAVQKCGSPISCGDEAFTCSSDVTADGV